jgi:CRISPR-associated protein Cas2
MMVVVVCGASPRLRGRLAVWLLEIRAGVYVGNYSCKVREMIWDQVVSYLESADAIMTWTDSSEQGFGFVTAGTSRRTPVQFDGFTLVQIAPNEKSSDGVPLPGG